MHKFNRILRYYLMILYYRAVRFEILRIYFIMMTIQVPNHDVNDLLVSADYIDR